MTTLLASLEDLAAVRGVAFDPTDIAAVFALEAASDAVRLYTHRTFDFVSDDTISLRGNGTDVLLLEPPVWDVSDVTVTELNASPVTLAITDYTFEERTGILRRTPWYVWPPYAVVDVTYSHGYVLPGNEGADLPADLQDVVVALAIARITRASQGGRTVESETIGRFSQTFSVVTGAEVEELTATQREALDRYRLTAA